MHNAGRIRIFLYIVLNQHERTSTCAVVCVRDVSVHFFKKLKMVSSSSSSSSSRRGGGATAAAAGVAAAATAAAAAAAAVGRTRPGSASMYARLVGLTLEPFVHVLDFVVCFPFPNSIRHNLKTKNLQPDLCPTELLVAGATTTTTAVRHLQQSFSCFSVLSSVGGWA